MNIKTPVSSLMSSPVYTIDVKDKLTVAKELFDQHSIHHLPVTKEGKIVGIISQVDLLHFLKGLVKNDYQEFMNSIRLKNYCAEDIMTVDLAVLKPNNTLEEALGIFKINRFHALPIVENQIIKGILTTHDIIVALYDERVKAPLS